MGRSIFGIQSVWTQANLSSDHGGALCSTLAKAFHSASAIHHWSCCLVKTMLLLHMLMLRSISPYLSLIRRAQNSMMPPYSKQKQYSFNYFNVNAFGFALQQHPPGFTEAMTSVNFLILIHIFDSTESLFHALFDSVILNQSNITRAESVLYLFIFQKSFAPQKTTKKQLSIHQGDS